MTVDIYNSYSGLYQFLICFHPESEIHYYEYQPDIVTIRDFLKDPRDLVPALQDAKCVLMLKDLPSEEIEMKTRYFEDKNEIQPWLLSALKLLEEEADRQGIEIPEDLRGLWRIS